MGRTFFLLTILVIIVNFGSANFRVNLTETRVNSSTLRGGKPIQITPQIGG